MNMFEDFSERVIANTGVYKDLTGVELDFVNLDQQTTIDILVGSGVDLDDPTTFVIDSCEGVTGDWSDVLESTNYMVSNDMEYIGIYHKGPASVGLLIHKAEYGELTFTIVDESGKPVHGVIPDNRNADIVDYDDVPDDEEDENGNPISQPTDYDCTVTLDQGEHYHVYQLGTFTLDEGERLLQALGELPITHNRIETNNFNELGYAWTTHDLNCADLLAAAELLGLIADWTFKLN